MGSIEQVTEVHKPVKNTHQEQIDREEQIKEFNKVLNSLIIGQPPQKTLLEWFGGPGIGKTELVKLLERESQQRGIPSVVINFKEIKEHSQGKLTLYESDPALLMEEMILPLTNEFQQSTKEYQNWQKATAAFRHELPPPPKNSVQDYFQLSHNERLYDRPEWLDRWRNVIIMYLELVKKLTTSQNAGQIRPLVFFFDETEHIEPILINWLEEWVISSILRTNRCLVVWTARQPWRWKLPEVRQKLESQPLPPFSPEHVQQQLEAGQVDLAQELFGSVYRLTEGHPFAGRLAVERIHEWQTAGEQVTSDFIWDQRAVLLKRIFERFIQNYAFVGLEKNVQTALKLMALVRIVDNKMLQALLQNHGGKKYVDLSVIQTQTLLLQLKRSQLLIWKKGHSLDTELRHLIRSYYLTNEPHIFRAVNQTALAINRAWLEKPVDNRNLFVIEELYHLASLQEAGEPVNFMAEFQKRLTEYDITWTDPEVRQSALERLVGELEADKELGQLINEFLPKLVKIVQKKRAEIEMKG